MENMINIPSADHSFEKQWTLRVHVHFSPNFSGFFQKGMVKNFFWSFSLITVKKCVCFHKDILRNSQGSWKKSPDSLFWKQCVWKKLTFNGYYESSETLKWKIMFKNAATLFTLKVWQLELSNEVLWILEPQNQEQSKLKDRKYLVTQPHMLELH